MYYLIDFEFTINLGSILAFFVGIVTGVILVFIIYFLIVLFHLKKQEIITNDLNKEIDVKQIQDEIKASQIKFINLKKNSKEITFDCLKEVCLELMNRIAEMYYPESKNPLGELTIKEVILLDQYLMEKFDELLNKVGLKFAKKITINRLLQILNMKKSIDNNSIVKATKKYSKPFKQILFILQLINPVMWIRKGIINPSINLIIKKIYLMIIALVGQETYHIYSKQAFLDPVVDEDIEKLIEIIENEQKQEETSYKKINDKIKEKVGMK